MFLPLKRTNERAIRSEGRDSDWFVSARVEDICSSCLLIDLSIFVHECAILGILDPKSTLTRHRSTSAWRPMGAPLTDPLFFGPTLCQLKNRRFPIAPKSALDPDNIDPSPPLAPILIILAGFGEPFLIHLTTCLFLSESLVAADGFTLSMVSRHEKNVRFPTIIPCLFRSAPGNSF